MKSSHVFVNASEKKGNTGSNTSTSSGSSSETEEVHKNLDIIKPVQYYAFDADRILFFAAFLCCVCSSVCSSIYKQRLILS